MLQALNDRVIVKLDAPPEKQGSIIAPDQARDSLAALRGVVVSVGPKANEHNRTPEGLDLIVVGCRVRLNKYSGLDVEPGDATLKAVSASELLAVETDSEDTSSGAMQRAMQLEAAAK